MIAMRPGRTVIIMNQQDQYYGKKCKITKVQGTNITVRVLPWKKKTYKARALKLINNGGLNE